MFHLAGVNRASHPEAFWEGEIWPSPGRFSPSWQIILAPFSLPPPSWPAILPPYGQSKLAAEEALLQYGAATGAEVFLYRLPHVFGRGSRPDYNSAVATFCHRMARGLPITIQNPGQRLHLAYVDDVVEEFLACFSGSPCQKDGFCHIPKVSSVTLEDILALLSTFNRRRAEGALPPLHAPFAKQLYATYLSFLPQEALRRSQTMHQDPRGSFTELFRTASHGQLSVSLTRPGIVRGNHWHRTKAETFWVVQGEGVIRLKSPTGRCAPSRSPGGR